jgi:hypothetical protein
MGVKYGLCLRWIWKDRVLDTEKYSEGSMDQWKSKEYTYGEKELIRN